MFRSFLFAGTALASVVTSLPATAQQLPAPAPVSSLVRAVDAPRMIGDNTRLRTTTGWTPRFTLAETLRDVLDAARARVATEPRD